MRNNNRIQDLNDQIEALRVNQIFLQAQNNNLRRRISQLENNTQATPQQPEQPTHPTLPSLGDRVKVHRPTIPARHTREIIPEDAIGAVDFAKDSQVCFTTDSGISRYRKSHNLTIIN